MNAIAQLAEIGTSTWLDDLSRDRITSGNLHELIATKSIQGVTTNPAIFAAAMSQGTAYDADLDVLKAKGATADEAVYSLAIEDVRNACDIFAAVFEATGGADGRVSIEVDPRISEDTQATIDQALSLWQRVDRPGAMIKIPATEGSLPAIVEVLAQGVSVNVTLIFSLERYRQVIEAYKAGIAKAAANGLEVSKIHSVASFFVSRLDTEVDARLESIGTEQALALRGKAGVANAQLAYQLFLDSFPEGSLPQGANLQRPLWASTGVKNPDYPPTLYVSELAGPHTVNTMPEGTIDATLANPGNLHGDTLTGAAAGASVVMDSLTVVGVDLPDVFATLEREGVDKFVDAWNALLGSISARLGS